MPPSSPTPVEAPSARPTEWTGQPPPCSLTRTACQKGLSSRSLFRRHFQNPSPGPSPEQRGEKSQGIPPPRFGEGPGEGFLIPFLSSHRLIDSNRWAQVTASEPSP